MSFLTKTLGGLFHPQPATRQSGAGPTNTPAKAESNALDNGRWKSDFDYSKEVNKTWSKQGGANIDSLFTPSTNTPAWSQQLGKLLAKLPEWSKSGSFSKDVALWQKNGSFNALGGLAQGEGHVSVGELYANGNGSISFKNGALNAQGDLHAGATLLDAEGHVHIGKGDYYLDAKGQAYVGAKADAHGELTIDPAHGVFAAKGGVDAFAGARAGVEGTANLGKFGSVGGSATAQAGIGVTAKGGIGYKDGKLQVGFELGAALGIGFKVGFHADINVKGIVDTVKNAISKPVEAVKDVVKNVISKPVEAVKSVGKSIAHFFGF